MVLDAGTCSTPPEVDIHRRETGAKQGLPMTKLVLAIALTTIARSRSHGQAQQRRQEQGARTGDQGHRALQCRRQRANEFFAQPMKLFGK
jgi:hypothetical protein